MASIKICDRCAAPAVDGTLDKTTRTIVIPHDDPATNVAPNDIGISVGMQTKEDLCPICQASVLLEYAAARFSGQLPASALAAFIKRLSVASVTKADA